MNINLGTIRARVWDDICHPGSLRFKANARSDVIDLLDEVERLTGIIGEAVHFLSSGNGISVEEGLAELAKILEGDAAGIYRKTLQAEHEAAEKLKAVIKFADVLPDENGAGRVSAAHVRDTLYQIVKGQKP